MLDKASFVGMGRFGVIFFGGLAVIAAACAGAVMGWFLKTFFPPIK